LPCVQWIRVGWTTRVLRMGGTNIPNDTKPDWSAPIDQAFHRSTLGRLEAHRPDSAVSHRSALVLKFPDARACLQSLKLEIAVGAFIWSASLSFKLQGLVGYIGDDGQSKGRRTTDLGPGGSCQTSTSSTWRPATGRNPAYADFIVALKNASHSLVGTVSPQGTPF